MTKLLKIKAFSASNDGSTNMLANRLAIIKDTSITLRSLIANKISEKVNEAVPTFSFCADQHIAQVVTTSDEMDVVELLDLPVSELLEFLSSPRPEIAVTINTTTEVSNNTTTDEVNSETCNNAITKTVSIDTCVSNTWSRGNSIGTHNSFSTNIHYNSRRGSEDTEIGRSNTPNNIRQPDERGCAEAQSPNDCTDNNEPPTSDQIEEDGNVPGDKEEIVNRPSSSTEDISKDSDANSEFFVDAVRRISQHDALLIRKASAEHGECKVEATQETNDEDNIGDLEQRKESQESRNDYVANDGGILVDELDIANQEVNIAKSESQGSGDDVGEGVLPGGLDALAQLVYKAFKANPQEAIKIFDPSKGASTLHLLGPMPLTFNNITDEVSVMTPTTCLLSEPDTKNLTTHEDKDESYLESSPDLASLKQTLNNCDDALKIIVLTQALMQDNSTAISFDVPSFCLNALWVLARKSDENKRKIIFEDSTFDAIIEAMQIYRESSSEIQIRGTGLLWTLAMNPKDRVHVAQLGGCAAILNAMSSHKDADKLIVMALGALKVISCDKVGKQMLNSERTPSIVTEVMKAHMYNPTVQCEGCILLGNLAVNDADQFVHPVSEKEINVVVNGMIANPDSLDVHEAACFTLMRLASSAANVELIRNNPTTKASLELAFQQNPDKVKNNILILLRRLRIDSPTINEAKAESFAYARKV